MQDSNQQEIKKPSDLTPEQLEEYRVKAEQFYTKQIPMLKVQLEYETLLRDIETAKAERMKATYTMAQISNTINPPNIKKNDKK